MYSFLKGEQYKDTFYVRVDVKKWEINSDNSAYNSPKVVENLHNLDASISVSFDTFADAKSSLALDLNDYVFQFGPPQNGKSGRALVWRSRDVYEQLADGVAMPTKAEVSKNLKCDFQRNNDGFTYIISFPIKYIQPIILREGAEFGLGIRIRDLNKNKHGGIIDRGLCNSATPSFNYRFNPDNKPQLWPIVILK